MNNKKLVFWVWSSMQQLPPHQLRIYPLNFIGAFFSVFCLTYIFTFSILIILTPSGPSIILPDGVGAAIKIPFWYFSHGLAWPSQAPKLLNLIRGKGEIVSTAITFTSIFLATFFGWLASRGSLTPIDGYMHIRGPKRYEGKEALELIKRQMSRSIKK